jgi:hypothetical protein
MRVPATTILAIGTILAAAPLQAQTYDPNFPVCMKLYSGGMDGGGEWIDCGYTTLPQCRASASGRAAMCELNPYFAQTDTRRLRRVYRQDRWAY